MPAEYRCAACGNRTRFDVVSTRTTREFWHFSLDGEHTIDDEEVLAERVESVTCRWCGSTTAIENVAETADDVPEQGAASVH